QSIHAWRASFAASRSTTRSSPSSLMLNRSRMMRSPSWRKWRRRQGTSKGFSCSRDQGSKATSKCFPSASTLYPRVFPRPDRKVVERHGRSVASFARIADLEEGMEANLRASVTGITPVRSFTRQDGTPGRVVNLELRDDSGFCRFVLWDEDVGLIERRKVVVGSTVR